MSFDTKRFFSALGSNIVSIVLLIAAAAYFSQPANLADDTVRMGLLGVLAAVGIFIVYDSVTISSDPKWVRQMVDSGTAKEVFGARQDISRQTMDAKRRPAMSAKRMMEKGYKSKIDTVMTESEPSYLNLSPGAVYYGREMRRSAFERDPEVEDSYLYFEKF